MEIKLNLIPQYKREQIKHSFLVRTIVQFEIEIFLVLVLFIAILFSMNYILRLNSSSVEQNSMMDGKKNQYEKIGEYENYIKNANLEIDKLNKIQKSQLYWSNLLVKLGNLDAKGISLNSLATKDYSIYISGKASSRDDLINFKNKLSSENCFENINLPLSDLTSKENIDFQIDFAVKKDCITKK